MKKKPVAVKYPYSRLKGLNEFMAFAKEPDWKPVKIDIELFRKLGLAKGKEGEAVYTLHFLGLIDDASVPTSDFVALKQDYQSTMKRLVEAKYAELFSLIPPRLANQMRLVNFFGLPVETAEYRAKLFVWLCEQSGIELPNVEKHFHRARFDKNEFAESE